MTWECVERPAKFFFGVHAATGTVEFKKTWGVSFPRLFAGFHGDTIVWCWNQEDLKAAGEKLFERFQKEPELAKKIKQQWQANAKKAGQTFEKLESDGILGLSNQEMAVLIEEMYQTQRNNVGVGLIWDIFDLVLETKIKKELEKKINPKTEKKEFAEAILLLTTPLEESFAKTEETELLKIAKEIQKKPEMEKLFSQNAEKTEKELSRYPVLGKKIAHHLKRFFWIRAGYSNGERLKKREVLERIAEAVRKKTENPEKTDSKKIISDKKQFLEKINASKALELAVEIIDSLGFLHDSKKELQMHYFCYSNELLLEAAKRISVPEKLIYWFTPKELSHALQTGEFDLQELKNRSQNTVFENVELEKFSAGKKAAEIENRVLGRKTADLSQLREVSGIGANPGTAVGKARVILTQKGLDQMQNGEILVTGMTTPDFVPAMKKAAGIVTEEGGILCHAAIVSRELKLPCVVGTKTATKVFKTGELIEVRANHGIVRKISGEK